jgi:tetratricopeptide (TPR) repeat protein
MHAFKSASPKVIRPSLRKGVFRLVGIVAALGSGPLVAQHVTPYVPDSPAAVLQRVPPATDPRVRRFEQLRTDAEAHPGDAQKAVVLAQAYIDFGRSTGDARYLGRAMAVIDPYMKAPSPPISAMLAHATIQQSRHAFAAARKELEQILRRAPDNAQAWLTVATVAMVQGDYRGANDACVHLANSGGDFMGMICTSSLRSLDGRAKQAYALLTLIEDPGPKAPATIRAWIESLMAETAARMGNVDVADAHFRRALQWTPGDNFLLADYGEFLLDHARPADALALVGNDTTSDTSFLIRVAAEVALKSPRAADDITAMDERFAAMAQRGDHIFLREQATYLLHVRGKAAEALTLARQNWDVQRAPKDARIYLEAALALHDPAAATDVLDFIKQSGMSDDTVNPLVTQAQAAIAVAQVKPLPTTTNGAARR